MALSTHYFTILLVKLLYFLYFQCFSCIEEFEGKIDASVLSFLLYIQMLIYGIIDELLSIVINM